ncbi:MAG: orotate phosphoribosyltransferase [Clostridiales bacterium]|nr:orotate phosphoribosyltransferase [Clostridiales bacterium]
MDELFNYRLNALNYRERFIRFMADNGVLQFGEFTLQSGRVSPYFINTGNYKSASQLSKLGEFYAECIRENNVETNLLVGNTHQEIPIMLSTSMVLFNRYGIDIHYNIDGTVGKQLDANDRVTLIKDTLTSGNTLRTSLQHLESEAGQRVSHVIVSVDRMERSNGSGLSARSQIEKAFGVKIHAIATLDDIIRAMEKGIIGGADYLDAVKRYREVYGADENGDR